MTRFLLLVALVIPALSQASLIPPHKTVVASCGQPLAVYVSTGLHTQRLTDPSTVHRLARTVSPAYWVDSGCRR